MIHRFGRRESVPESALIGIRFFTTLAHFRLASNATAAREPRRLFGLAAGALLVLISTLRLPAQTSEVRIDLAEVATLAQFARAEQSVRAGLWDEAVDALLRAGDLGGERLVSVAPERDIPHGRHFQRHITAQRLAQFQLAEIFNAQPETLRIYRRRVDPTAQRLAREAQGRQDAAVWEPLLQRYPLSGPADAAWLRYGESQLEAGNHHLARAAFETLHPHLRTPFPKLVSSNLSVPGEPVPRKQASDAANHSPSNVSAGASIVHGQPQVPAGRSWWWTFRAADRLEQIASFDVGRLDAAGPASSQSTGPVGSQSSGRTGSDLSGRTGGESSRPLIQPVSQPATGPAGQSESGRASGSTIRGEGDAARALPGLLTYPDSEVTEAELAARLVATSILEGDRERAVWELERLRRLFPDSQGEMQGRRGLWHELLNAWLEASRGWPAGEANGTTARQGVWTQFAGGAERSGRAAPIVDLAGRPRWSISLTPVVLPSVDVAVEPLGGAGANRDTLADTAQRATSQPPVLLASYPIVGAGYVAVQDASGVMVRRAATGESAFGVERDARLFANPLSPQWLAPRDARRIGLPRFPLAIDGGLLWACVGAPWQSFDRPRSGEPQPPRLIGLSLEAEGRAEASWNLAAAPWGPEWTWEGPPVCVAGRAYAGLRRVDTVESQSHVACFDIATGRLRWRRLVAAAHSPRPARSLEWTRHLLTWYEGRLFVHADVGAVACLNPRDGGIEWLVRYPRFESQTVGTGSGFAARELSPCVVDRGVVYVAAADQPGVFALEAATGQLLWASDNPALGDSEYFLGIFDGHLVAGGRRLTWIDAATGRLRCQFPPESDADGPRGFGRGLVAGDEVWWPTRDRLLAFRAAPFWDGASWRPRASRQFDLRVRDASGGNLAAADGLLFIAGPDRLYAFGP